jgi:hypothetical protein
MLTRAAPWRAFGNADVQGAAGVGATMQRRLVGNGITLIGHPRRARRARDRHPLRPESGSAVSHAARMLRRRCPRPCVCDLRGNHPEAGRSRRGGAGDSGRCSRARYNGPRDACRPRCAAPYNISSRGRCDR